MIASNYTDSKALVGSEFLGLQTYDYISNLQDQMHDSIRGTHLVKVLGMEFEPVITLGIRGNFGFDVVQTGSDVKIPVVKTDRGGQATLHTPGQLVIYPIMDLKQFHLGVKDFVCLVIKTTSRVLSNYGIESFSREAPGLYTKQGKLVFLGIRLEQGVVKHGLSINVNNDLSLFRYIKSCGVSAAALDKMQNYAFPEKPIPVKAVFESWINTFESELRSFNKLSQNCVKSFTIDKTDTI